MKNRWKQNVFIVGLSALCAASMLLTGCSFYKTVEEESSVSTADILDYVDEDQVAGNTVMIESVLQLEELGVSEEDAPEKASELMDMLWTQCGASVIDSFGLGTTKNSLLALDNNGFVWNITYEGTGEDLTFVSIKEADTADYEYLGVYGTQVTGDTNTEEEE